MKRISRLQPHPDFLGGTDDEVHGKRGGNGQANLECLIELVAGRHDYQYIDVAPLMRRPIGMRAEEDDLFRAKLLGHFSREGPNDAEGNVRTQIELFRKVAARGCHRAILPRRNRNGTFGNGGRNKNYFCPVCGEGTTPIVFAGTSTLSGSSANAESGATTIRPETRPIRTPWSPSNSWSC
jgi:hypothetical protein